MAHSPPLRLLLPLLLLLSFSTLATSSRHSARSKPKPKQTPSNSPPSPSPPLPSAPLPILLACNATRFHSLCVSSLTSPSTPPSPSPLSLLSTSFSASLSSISPAISTAKFILSLSSNNPNRSNAATNCIEFLTLSSYRLTTASKLISLSSPPLPSVRILSSAALLYQYDCWSAYKYVNDSSKVSDAMAFLANNLTALTSNTISMVAALQRYGDDTSLWGPPQTERDGYWPQPAAVKYGDGSDIGGVPTGLKPAVTVCKTGTCDYDTVQKAVDAALENGKNWYVVYIKSGVYEETVRVPYEKTNVVFVGDGMGRTVITGSLNADTVGVSTYNTATVGMYFHAYIHACIVVFQVELNVLTCHWYVGPCFQVLVGLVGSGYYSYYESNSITLLATTLVNRCIKKLTIRESTTLLPFMTNNSTNCNVGRINWIIKSVKYLF